MKNRPGFTMIEVALFLAITGALFVGIAASMNFSIHQQRYNDSVQNFTDFIRGIYSEVENVQGIGDGRSDRAIYGKLVTFGEEYNFSGELNENHSIFVYDVVGDVKGLLSSSGVLNSLKNLNANVVIESAGTWGAAGLTEEYRPKWGATIEQKESHDLFKGSLLIVRSPSSGTVYTYVQKGKTIEVNKALISEFPEELNSLLRNAIDEDAMSESTAFRIQQVDFCINPDGDQNFSGLRRDIRINENAHNSSNVFLPSDEESECQNI